MAELFAKRYPSRIRGVFVHHQLLSVLENIHERNISQFRGNPGLLGRNVPAAIEMDVGDKVIDPSSVLW